MGLESDGLACLEAATKTKTINDGPLKRETFEAPVRHAGFGSSKNDEKPKSWGSSPMAWPAGSNNTNDEKQQRTVNTKMRHFGLQSDGLACLEATTTMKSNYKTINARKKRTGLQCDTLACWKQQHRLKTTNNIAKTLLFFIRVQANPELPKFVAVRAALLRAMSAEPSQLAPAPQPQGGAEAESAEPSQNTPALQPEQAAPLEVVEGADATPIGGEAEPKSGTASAAQPARASDKTGPAPKKATSRKRKG